MFGSGGYHILPELHLRRVFPGVQFVNTNLPEERSKVLLTEEQLSSLPEDSTDIFRRNNIDRYVARQSVSFCDGKYRIFDSFCFAEFTAHYSLIYKPKEANEGEEYQADLLPDSLIEVNHENLNYPKIIKLMISNERMHCRKVRQVLRYHTLNKYRFPEKYAHHLIFLFFHSDQKKNFSEDICPHIKEN